MSDQTKRKWARLRRWLKVSHAKEVALVTTVPGGFYSESHRRRAEAFMAVLLVMDMENRRARRRHSRADRNACPARERAER